MPLIRIGMGLRQQHNRECYESLIEGFMFSRRIPILSSVAIPLRLEGGRMMTRSLATPTSSPWGTSG